jgi:hypothetical protein
MTKEPKASRPCGPWTECENEYVFRRALQLAHGSYQKDVLDGLEALSGSTLKGKARDYTLQYAVSRRNLLKRLEANGVHVSERKNDRGARILVLSDHRKTAWEKLNEDEMGL